VTLILLGVQVFFILLVFSLQSVSDHIVLPVISAIVLLLGSRLDQIAVKYVKKKVAKEPRILEIKKLSDVQRKKIKLEKKAFENTGINLN
jgi:hypothetical protein